MFYQKNCKNKKLLKKISEITWSNFEDLYLMICATFDTKQPFDTKILFNLKKVLVIANDQDQASKGWLPIGFQTFCW